MTRVVVSPFSVVDFKEGGGHLSVYLQHVYGLKAVGCDVYWMEQVKDGGDRQQLEAQVGRFLSQMAGLGLYGKVILYRAVRDRVARSIRYEFLTPAAAEARAVLRSADLLVNFHYEIDAEVLTWFRRTALVDIDPGLLQFWWSRGQIFVPPHDVYFTIGETVGTPAALFPDCGIEWKRIRPAVSLEHWPYRFEPGCQVFTTVSNWWGGGWLYDGESAIDNNKRAAFLDYQELPRRTPQLLELAINLSAEEADERRMLEGLGWRIRHPREVAASLEHYQRYIQQSRGEFSCAKRSCRKFQNAWVSDRTLCYLATGRPAVVEHTGPSGFLPDGPGMFRFQSVEEAVQAFAAINADYEKHCRAARELAETHFDARVIARRILETGLQPAASDARFAKVASDALFEHLDRVRADLIGGFGADCSVEVASTEPALPRLLVHGPLLATSRVVFKDFHAARARSASGPLAGEALDRARTEWFLYRQVLDPVRDSTPRLFGGRFEPDQRRAWLILEELGPAFLGEDADDSACSDAARWLAGFHDRHRDDAPVASTLRRFDRTLLWSRAEKIKDRMAEFDPEDRPTIQAAFERYVAALPAILSQPAALLHGGCFARRFLKSLDPARRGCSVVAWGDAALGPRTFDLACLLAGFAPRKRECTVRAYYEEARRGGAPWDWEEYLGWLKDAGLMVALSFLGRRPPRSDLREYELWFGEIERVVKAG